MNNTSLQSLLLCPRSGCTPRAQSFELRAFCDEIWRTFRMLVILQLIKNHRSVLPFLIVFLLLLENMIRLFPLLRVCHTLALRPFSFLSLSPAFFLPCESDGNPKPPHHDHWRTLGLTDVFPLAQFPVTRKTLSNTSPLGAHGARHSPVTRTHKQPRNGS